MEFFKKQTRIDFMGQRRGAIILSLCLFGLAIGAVVKNGLNLGLDFTGGTQIEVHYQVPPSVDGVREQLSQHGFSKAVVQSYGTAQDVLVRLGVDKTLSQEQLKAKFIEALPEAQIERVEFIGPQVGQTLITNGVLAMTASLLATMLYIAMRFEWRFALSAAISLIHDPILILGTFAWLHLEFNLIALAALLTILGYSLNDTIVVYDRVRENFPKLRRSAPVEVMNTSINQTLSRTIMTSGLTLLVVVALLVFGGETMRGFSIALIVGIVVGTYSSIYIAGALSLLLGLDREALLPSQEVGSVESVGLKL